MTRRAALAGAAGVAVGAGLDQLLLRGDGSDGTESGGLQEAVAFYGAQQGGIATPAQEFLAFAAFDVTSTSVDDLREILKEWTAAAAALTAGRMYGGPEAADAAPVDTGEAVGIGPAQLTITVGFGPSLFGAGGEDRFGLGRRRPGKLEPLPPFRGESLDPDRSGGDLCIQACADNPQVGFHAIHVLARLASGGATLRWTSRALAAPRAPAARSRRLAT